MATITLNKEKLQHNYRFLNNLFESHCIQWSVVAKLLCGNIPFLQELLGLGVKQVCDSRVANLKRIKTLAPNVKTIYIKPPAASTVEDIVEYADYSFNTELYTIGLLSEEAARRGKTHKVVIAIELGELREGVLRDDVVDFYRQAFAMPNIEIAGLASNFACLYGVLPSVDKLIQMGLFAQLVEAKFGQKLKIISGGSSVSIPLIMNGTMPAGINHFRVGETLFFGTNVYNDSRIEGMEYDVFKLNVSLLEVSEKPMVPSGIFGTNVEGDHYKIDESLLGKTSVRGIIDIGILDVDTSQLHFTDESIKIVGASSDMIVLDLGDNPNGYKTGDQLEVALNYMSALKLISSNYTDKVIV